MKKLLISASLVFVAAAALSQSGGLDTWSTIASDGGSFALPGPSLLRYGAPGQWRQIVFTPTSGVCSLAGLGLIADPAPGRTKRCERRDGASLIIDSAGGATTHKNGLEINQASEAAANAVARQKPGIAYPALAPTTPVYPAGYPPAYVMGTTDPGDPSIGHGDWASRPPGFTRFAAADNTTYNLRSGDIRTFCNISNFSHNDPIVHPGEPDSTHAHAFFGNAQIDAYSTVQNLRTRNNPHSTCAGGTVNLTGYWMPAMLRIADKTIVVPSKPVLIYYKSTAWPYIANTPLLEDLPVGLRFITGDATRRVVDTNIGDLECANLSSDPPSGIPVAWTLTDMAACNSSAGFPWTLWIRVEFPPCWNGQLDSANHRSHVVFPISVNIGTNAGRNLACPATNPLVMVNISEVFKYAVTPTDHPGLWTLSSDAYMAEAGNTLKAGLSLHADWMNGWDPAISAVFSQLCHREGRDCKNFNVGDDRSALYFQGNLNN